MKSKVTMGRFEDARIDPLDAAIAQGLGDIDAGRTKPAEEVFARLEAKYRAMAQLTDDRRSFE